MTSVADELIAGSFSADMAIPPHLTVVKLSLALEKVGALEDKLADVECLRAAAAQSWAEASNEKLRWKAEWEDARRVIAELERIIGEPPAGSHPDEWKPRAGTWHQERANWASEVERQKAYIEELAYQNADIFKQGYDKGQDDLEKAPSRLEIDLEFKVAELERELDEAMKLLAPTCQDETLLGTIRNLQQAHLAEKENVEQLERENTQYQNGTNILVKANSELQKQVEVLRDILLEVSEFGTKDNPCWCCSRNNDYGISRDDSDHDTWCDQARAALSELPTAQPQQPASERPAEVTDRAEAEEAQEVASYAANIRERMKREVTDSGKGEK